MYASDGTPSQLLRSRVRLSPDKADSTDDGTENIVRVARLFLKEKKQKLFLIGYGS